MVYVLIYFGVFGLLCYLGVWDCNRYRDSRSIREQVMMDLDDKEQFQYSDEFYEALERMYPLESETYEPAI